ncbi:Nucleolar complex protein 3-like [Vitis vinifera]|uniref:Nucleolar complex protein 3-like n=1 Tax=Vitis vinifera TaxID=29760 RepID=A0A438HYQ6_VITVI|nr:Nucleolar complex protein 3-like [Vitis vinifera]
MNLCAMTMALPYGLCAAAHGGAGAEVKEDLTAEETFESKKRKLAELGMALLADPEANIKTLKEMLQISKDDDQAIVKLALLSLLAVFKDIIPGYRIRLPTEKELEMTVSKEVKKKRPHFSILFIAVSVLLLDAVPHFNFRESLLAAVIKNIGSSDDVVRKLCCATVKSLFTNDGKHGGEATVEAVQLIADHVKAHDCQLHPDSIEVFMYLTFDEDLGRPENPNEDNKVKSKKNKKRKNREESVIDASHRSMPTLGLLLLPQMLRRRRMMQSEALSAVFETYFRILKHSMRQISVSKFQSGEFLYFGNLQKMGWGSEENGSSLPGASGNHPLLVPCLIGLGKFSHLIDLDFMGDLMNCLRKLACGSSNSDGSCNKLLTVSERLRCCIVAFKVMRNNLEALNVDYRNSSSSFTILLLSTGPEVACKTDSIGLLKVRSMKSVDLISDEKEGWRGGGGMRTIYMNAHVQHHTGLIPNYQSVFMLVSCKSLLDQGEVLAEALKIMLCDDRQHDMQKAAAFIKRLATFSLCFGSAESMAALVTLKHLLQKNVKCRHLLENDAGGGSVLGSIVKYQPYASDPSQSGALASVLWELNLLSKHYHPAVSTMASNVSGMSTGHNQVYLATVSPQQAFADLSLEHESFINPKNIVMKSNHKRKRGSGSSGAASINPTPDAATPIDEDGLRNKLSEHFTILHDIKENERLRGELDRVTLSLQVYEEHKNQKKRKHASKPKKNAEKTAS